MLYMANYTNQGGRPYNEDSYGVFTKGNGLCAAVADGLGGYGGGDIASRTAVNMIGDFYMEASDLSGKRIRDWFSQINRQVYDMQTGECKMKTTLAVFFASSTQCRWAHVGDTRVYHFLNNDLKDMTLDHSVPQMAVFSGEITQAEIRQHKNRNKLLRAIGYQTEIEADVSTVIDITRGNHSFLLCTDGFWEYVEEDEMADTLAQSSNPVEWINKMTVILQSRVTGKNDNNTNRYFINNTHASWA